MKDQREISGLGPRRWVYIGGGRTVDQVGDQIFKVALQMATKQDVGTPQKGFLSMLRPALCAVFRRVHAGYAGTNSHFRMESFAPQ
jgi:hypothetical protein